MDTGSDSLEIAVYGEINTETVVYIAPPPPPPPFIPGVTGGGGAILRCSAPPAESCPGYDDVVPAEITLLSATLTVGTHPRFGFLGWNDFGSFTGASLTDQNFTFGGDTYDVGEITFAVGSLSLVFDEANAGDIAIQATRDKLTLHLGSDSFNLGAGTLASDQRTISWTGTGLTWAAGNSVAVKITATPPPNAYGYRTIWNALMTAGPHPTVQTTFGYSRGAINFGEMTNNLIVQGRTDRGVIDDQFRYPGAAMRSRK